MAVQRPRKELLSWPVQSIVVLPSGLGADSWSRWRWLAWNEWRSQSGCSHVSRSRLWAILRLRGLRRSRAGWWPYKASSLGRRSGVALRRRYLDWYSAVQSFYGKTWTTESCEEYDWKGYKCVGDMWYVTLLFWTLVYSIPFHRSKHAMLISESWQVEMGLSREPIPLEENGQGCSKNWAIKKRYQQNNWRPFNI